jgi:hypothetical protein
MMSLSAIERESREYAPMVRASGSLPNPGSALHVGSSPCWTWERTVPGPAEAPRRQVRSLPSPCAAMHGFALSRELTGRGFFLQQ